MSDESLAARRGEAAAEFDRHENRNDGARIVSSLADGLGALRDSFFQRVHRDVEQVFGMDSMLLPVSETQSRLTTHAEIDIYGVAEVAISARDFGYVADASWFPAWLASNWLGVDRTNPAIERRLQGYINQTTSERWRAFSTRLVHVMPEAGQAPLVIYRLFPLAIAASTAVAFGDHQRGETIRKQQIVWLSSIADCHVCRGRLLENSEKCAQCGNPFWKYDWLTAD